MIMNINMPRRNLRITTVMYAGLALIPSFLACTQILQDVYYSPGSNVQAPSKWDRNENVETFQYSKYEIFYGCHDAKIMGIEKRIRSRLFFGQFVRKFFKTAVISALHSNIFEELFKTDHFKKFGTIFKVFSVIFLKLFYRFRD